MQRKLFGIINVDFDTTGELLITYSAFVTLLIIYSAFVKHLSKNGNITKQCIISLQTSRKLMIQL